MAPPPPPLPPCPLLVATVCKRCDHVAAVEDAVSVPVTLRPTNILTCLILSRREDLNHITRVEFPIEVGIAEPGVLEIFDPDAVVILVDFGVAIEIECRIRQPRRRWGGTTNYSC